MFFIIIINKIYAVEFMNVMTHNDTIRTHAVLYLFSDDVNLKLNVKSTGGLRFLTEEPFFLSRNADDETERLRWRAQKPAEDLRAYNQSFSLWNLKVIQFALETAPWKSEEDFK